MEAFAEATGVQSPSAATVKQLRSFLESQGAELKSRMRKAELVAMATTLVEAGEEAESREEAETGAVVGVEAVTAIKAEAAGEWSAAQIRAAATRTTSVVLAVWAYIVVYSLVVSAITEAPWWAMVAYYAIGMGFLYNMHWLVHQPWAWPIYTAHAYHHEVECPPTAFLAGAEGSWLERVALTSGGLAIIAATVVLLGVPVGVAVGALGLYAWMGALGSYMHGAFHTRDHWLEKHDWFRVLRAMHYIHHVGDRPGYGIDVDVLTQPRMAEACAPLTPDSLVLVSHYAQVPPPDGFLALAPVTRSHIAAAAQVGPLIAYSLSMEIPLPLPGPAGGFPDTQQRMEWAVSRGFGALLVRLSLSVALALTWIISHNMLTSMSVTVEPKQAASFAIGDTLHEITYLWHHYLAAYPETAAAIILGLDALIDILVFSIIVVAVMGPTMRPVFSGYASVVLRQIAQLLCELPAPSSSLWTPSASSPLLFHAYATNVDFFFSMYPAIAVVASVELLRILPRGAAIQTTLTTCGAIVLVAGISILIAILRMDWTLSLFTGVLAGAFAVLVGARPAHCGPPASELLRLKSSLKRTVAGIHARAVARARAAGSNAVFPPTATLAPEPHAVLDPMTAAAEDGAVLASKLAVDADGPRLSIATYNLWNTNPPWEARAKAMAAMLNALAPQVLALQEVRILPDGGNQADALIAMLQPQYSVVYARVLGTPGSADEEGIALATTLDIVSSAEHPLPPMTGNAVRMLLHVRLRLPGSGDDDDDSNLLDVFATHWPVYDYEQCNTALQVAAIARKVWASNGGRIAQIVLGDFNAYFDFDEPMRILTEPSSPFVAALAGDALPSDRPFVDVFDVLHPAHPPRAPPDVGADGKLPERWWGAPEVPVGTTFSNFADHRIQDSSRPDRILARGDGLQPRSVHTFGGEPLAELFAGYPMFPSDHRGSKRTKPLKVKLKMSEPSPMPQIRIKMGGPKSPDASESMDDDSEWDGSDVDTAPRKRKRKNKSKAKAKAKAKTRSQRKKKKKKKKKKKNKSRRRAASSDSGYESSYTPSSGPSSEGCSSYSAVSDSLSLPSVESSEGSRETKKARRRAKARMSAAKLKGEGVSKEPKKPKRKPGKGKRSRKRGAAGDGDYEQAPDQPAVFGVQQAGTGTIIRDCSNLKLKPDSATRPIWITDDGHIFLESFSPLYQIACDFLVAVAEPVCRARLIQEYKLGRFSLYAAISVGLDADKIIKVLDKLSKVTIPQQVINDVRTAVANYGKTKIVLRQSRYYLETTTRDVLEFLLTDPELADTIVVPSRDDEAGGSGGSGEVPADAAVTGATMSYADAIMAMATGKSAAAVAAAAKTTSNSGRSLADRVIQRYVPGASETRAGLDDVLRGTQTHMQREGDGGELAALASGDGREADDDDDGLDVFGAAYADAHERFFVEFIPNQVSKVRMRATKLDFPVLAEYDFRNDDANASLDVHLKPMTSIRPYQEKALRKMFGNGRARSGIIVLPCGAGKTLVGITACTTIKKSCIVMCTSEVAVEQWKRQFQLWCQIDESCIMRFTKDSKDFDEVLATRDYKRPIIVISTYTMIGYAGKRANKSKKVMDYIRAREWGLLVLDEVQVAPADNFSRCCKDLQSHCKLGLTATLVREDDRIKDLNYLIGPKLYEANWLDLQDAGYIARVQCAEVWCQMTPAFYREYLRAEEKRRKLLYVMNPNKFLATEFLIRYHERRGDKILVFSDNLFALEQYSELLQKPLICGATPAAERLQILYQFQHNPALNVVCISKVGDNSIDLPGASVVIQVAAHYGSRRQEAQRLGRILRAKVNTDGGFNAFFYSVVSKDTQEMAYSSKRQQFLVNQGYSFKVISHLPHTTPEPGSMVEVLMRKETQDRLLTNVLHASIEAGETERDYDDADYLNRATGAATRVVSSMDAIGSTGSGLVYSIFNPVARRAKPKRKPKARRGRADLPQGSLFKKFFQPKVRSKEEKEAAAQALREQRLKSKFMPATLM
ncbi:uncharacterized protein AMSG_11780 [Thecamonas trahens ATCC 50062]|uniref:DNA 3'-5' helicase n=1 Tax=Thecamonas trahens ATCC 50062 TaxID=461836 RepID=A0A0L0D5C4_THETB|nr:hypothetical protein AMSG_11780 [Thecamonas trahens ATCC 50062]KNC47281.1 hypothetical protein AMSG_11780 [Thecamonas trahens ATCC 50062]|eukprot:XP_013759769.1 hypothetical protein AMSG_11780 [Thecamonas trahens ATCC 50062]